MSLANELSEETAQKEYVEIEARYNFSEKEKIAKKEKNKRKNAEMRLYIVGASTTVMLLFVWLFYRGQKIKREKKLLVLQKETLIKEREIEQLNNEAQIKILNAKKSFIQGAKKIEVLKGVNATFEKGKTYAISGVSGSGKSTLISLLAGFDSSTSGKVLFDNTETDLLKKTKKYSKIRSAIGVVFQLPYLIKELTVLENVMI